jgi:hypothetical protein
MGIQDRKTGLHREPGMAVDYGLGPGPEVTGHCSAAEIFGHGGVAGVQLRDKLCETGVAQQVSLGLPGEKAEQNRQ